MSNDWTNKLRDRMADYQEPVKDDLWAAIDQSLAHQSDLHPNRKDRVVWMRRFSMAAAIAAFAVGGTYVYLNHQNAITEKGKGSAQVASLSPHKTTVSDLRDKNTAGSYSDNVPAEYSGKPLPSYTGKPSSAHSRMAPSEQIAMASHHEIADTSNNEVAMASLNEPTVASEVPVSSASPQEKKKSSVKSQTQTLSPAQDDLLLASAYDAPLGRRKSGSGWSLQMYGANGVIGNLSDGNGPTASSYVQADPVFSNGYVNNSVIDSKLLSSFYLNEFTEEVHHHQPISVGVQVGYTLTPRLQLTTGVVYTRTSSDFVNSTRNGSSTTNQVLHYIGIPLNLNYRVWSIGGFHTYLTAGAEGDVNVKNHTETDGVEVESKRDRMQWSALFSAGAQYDVIPELGVYVEPGAKYYFDNGSQVENVFKDKKLNFNIQFGLRWNIGK